MIKEAIILAGGLGTRLRSVVNDVPKCMAPVNGIPFLNFVIAYLKNEGIERIILSLGYKSELIIEHIEKNFTHAGIEIDYVIEASPLGTGGAIKLACSKVKGNQVLVLNGDTLFNINLRDFAGFHLSKKADFTAALKEMKDFSRYGAVDTDVNHRLTAFHEKTYCEKGLINGGIYALSKEHFLAIDFPAVFSFEKDFLEAYLTRMKFYGFPFNDYFIDIGIPEDYQHFAENYAYILSRTRNRQTGSAGFGIVEGFFEYLGELLL